MRALNRVRVPRAMWRVGTCLSMRVVLTPHICRRSLRVVTRALVPAQDVDMYSSRLSCDKQKRSTFQNRAYDLSTRLWGRERTNGARGTHHRIILKFRIFSSDRKAEQ